MVTVLLVTLTVPPVLPVRTLAVKVSGPSVVASDKGATTKDPLFELMVKLPLPAKKSSGLLTVQYNVVPSGTPWVETLKSAPLPSSTLADEGVIAYVVSLIVTAPLVALIVPLTLSVRMLAVKVSDPSVIPSSVGVTIKDPLFEFMVKLPLLTEKSSGLLTVQ
jgi:hypothetical protein